MASGWVLLVGLNGLAVIAAVAVAFRCQPEGRAELGVTSALLWHGIIVGPLMALAWSNRLTATTLAWASLATSVAALGASYVGRSRSRHTSDVLVALWQLAQLPHDALVATWRRRSFAFVGVLASLVVLLWTAWLSYLAPSTGWDGIWYHETMVGFAIQNHGFRVVEIPAAIQHINGFPKACESLNLWFVIFTDRRLIEVPQTVMGAPLMLSFYVIARRFTERVNALGWASALLLMPGVVLELKSTYIDVHVAALLLMALALCTRPTLRLRHAWLASLALGILLASKSFALVWVPWFALIAAIRIVAQNRLRPWPTAGTLLGGTLLILALGAPTYVRNWIVFHNPLWPIAITNERLGIHWAAPHVMDGLNKPFKELILTMLTMPVPGSDWPDTRVYGYGIGVAWMAVPLGTIGLAVALVRWAAGAIDRTQRNPRASAVLLATAPILATMVISPALWAARYNIHVAAAFLLLAAWLVGSPGWARAREGAIAVMVMTSLMMLWWAKPGWGVDVEMAFNLAALPAPERAAHHGAEYMMAPKTALARDVELGPGDLTVFTDQHMFPSLLWNERFTNRVAYVPEGADPDAFVDRVESAGAKWVVVGGGSQQMQVLQRRSALWEVVGDASTTGPPTVAFRRRHAPG